MSAAAAAVLKAALDLTADEKKEVIDSLWDSMPDEIPELDPAFVAELNRRSDEIDAGTAKGRTWDQVKTRLEQELADAS
jgi:putative addiction module component (TIGR02574 family)